MRLPAVLCLLLLLIFELSSCTNLRVIPGSSLELPCLTGEEDIFGATFTWKFNGEDVNAQSSVPVKVIKDGAYISISPVTAANQGEYVCLVKRENSETINMYNIAVVASISFTIKVNQGSDVYLPCYLPRTTQVSENARWSKEPSKRLHTEDENNKKIMLVYPNDYDQTIVVKHVAMEDTGTYHCESADGEKLSTVYLIVEAAIPKSFSCENFTMPWEACMDVDGRTGEAILQESMTEFSMSLYSHLRHIHPTSNLLFSPISIGGALSHLLLGARDTTRDDIERAVSLPHDFHCIHSQMRRLKNKLSSSLPMASQIFFNPQMNLSESFIAQSAEFYEAKPIKLLENGEENAQMINSWVANKTKNKVTHLVDTVSPGTQLMLLNAVSYSGQWKVKFDQKPKKRGFTKLNGDIVKVETLYHQKYMAAMGHVVELQAQVARFALTGETSLYVLLPRSKSAADLQQVEERMTDGNVRQMIQYMKTIALQQIEVTLPHIKLDVEPNMNVLMKKLGLTSLFEGANLCGMYSTDKLVLDDARHRATLALTEKGVEAGAVTSVSFSRSFPSFSALRPFLLLLWSDQANVPLFIGRVTDPE
ncbi:plasma protease C1 inhibitor [Betta splendens]|uniref:Plasma protease C1 inhibitor n=1 Tax=Betta splendens TaxID=158456 RepID=A0A6P7M644_BETSP|nr:plasma protease C1 inhibitor [Betta splendens]XP_029001529.1 plasma protease C1 inhibitor [Betta splendens]